MSIQYTVNKWDYVFFQSHALQPLSLILNIFVYFSLFRTVTRGGFDLLICAIAALILLIPAFIFIKALSSLASYLMISLSKDTAIGTFELTLAETRLIERSEMTTSEFDYSLVHKVAYSSKRVYIYLGRIRAFIIPISAFRTLSQTEEFFATLYLRCQKRIPRRSYARMVKKIAS